MNVIYYLKEYKNHSYEFIKILITNRQKIYIYRGYNEEKTFQNWEGLSGNLLAKKRISKKELSSIKCEIETLMKLKKEV